MCGAIAFEASARCFRPWRSESVFFLCVCVFFFLGGGKTADTSNFALKPPDFINFAHNSGHERQKNSCLSGSRTSHGAP